MPANKNAMTRYKILDELLSNKYHNYSLDDLTNEVNKLLADMGIDGVGRRTIEKDINYLEYEGPFMVEIERYSAAGYDTDKQKLYSKRCLRYADPSFSIFKKVMSDDEKHLLKEALSILGQFDGLPNLNNLEHLRLGLDINSNDKHIISFSKNPLENSSILGELFTAISQKQVIELHYHTFNEPDNELKTNLHPYLLKEYNRRWYLLAAAENDGKLLNFSLDRIDGCTPLPSHKYVDYDGNISERFENIIGVTYIEENPLLKIIFWVSDTSKSYVVTKPIHESQSPLPKETRKQLREKHPSLKGGDFFRIDCKENYELIRELTSFGKNLVVLKPQKLQEKIFDHIKAMQNEYLNLQT